MSSLMKCILAGLALTVACHGCASDPSMPDAKAMVGQDGLKGFQYRTLIRGEHIRKYGMFVPLTYSASRKYPVIIFLHGIGESQGFGEGDGKNLNVGLGPSVAMRKDTFPFICIFPQCDGNWNADTVYADDVIAALDDVSKHYSVDPDRVTLTGTSIGGYGAYVIGAKYHDRFAAIVPLCSNGEELSVAQSLTRIPIRAYRSSSGDVFAGNHDQEMVDAITKRGGKAEFITTPTVGHNCWDYVYGSGELYAWIAQQRRSTVAVAAASPRTPAPAAPAPATPAAPAVRSPIAAAARPKTNLIFPGTTY